MIVEGQGMGFWTRVRLPPNPFGNTVKSRVSAIDKMKDTQKSTHSKKKGELHKFC